MSAFICSEFHISYIVQAGIDYKAWISLNGEYGYLTKEKAQHVFEVLMRENMRSVRVRYNEKEAWPVGLFIKTVAGITPLQTIKAINCLVYQSCESRAWESSLAKTYCDAITGATVRSFPGYGDLQWEVVDPIKAVA